MRKILLTVLLLFFSVGVQAQEIDSVHVDTTSFPGPTYVRIKFPHDGFRLTRYVQRDFNSYPPWKAISFWFKECTGTPGVTYYDTLMTQYVYKDNYITIGLVLDTNTWDTTCVLRPSAVVADSLAINYFTPPTAVKCEEATFFSCYPNPVINHRLTIETTASRSRPIMATFYSLQGSKVATYKLSEAKTEIALSPHLPAGNYVVLIQLLDGTTARRLVMVQ